jgi:hypothetical protein
VEASFPEKEEFPLIFTEKRGVFNKKVILLIDEVDSLPTQLLETIVHYFRKMYLNREPYLLHGLALVGVRAVAGVESDRGSPFNVQRSLRVENFTREEVFELYNQYIAESGQAVTDEVINLVYEKTDGQPGLVNWFGELLTEKFNPGKDKPIDRKVFEQVYLQALYVEPNNTVLNIVKKAKRYKENILEIFENEQVKFSYDKDWCNYLYMHGIIKPVRYNNNIFCRIANEFIHTRIFNALGDDIFENKLIGLLIEPLDELEDVFLPDKINCTGLITRYKQYLERLSQSKLNPFDAEIRRSDGRIYESSGHFHLYAWLYEVLKRRCVIVPEFPTGNGRVDLLIKCGEKRGIIEVKVFRDKSTLEEAKKQAAAYAKKLKLSEIVIALFVNFDKPEWLARLRSDEKIENVRVITEPIVFMV